MKHWSKTVCSLILCSAVILSLTLPAFAAETYPVATRDILVRDPYVLVHDGKYYMYGTGLASGKGYGVVVSEDLQHWSERKNVFSADASFDGYADFWAPECHYYNGAFYLFATYRSRTTEKRGTAVFRSDRPDGDFVPLGDGPVTPREIDCIDGTLYIDKEGKPWIVYVNEWTSSPDGIGEMAAARLSDDLSARIGDPIVLFRANGHYWTDDKVTDGPFMYRTKNGVLIMLWSNMAKTGGYAVGCARSDNGEIDGNWIQQPEAVYKQGGRNEKDGGHAMIFTDRNGQLMMALHSPNNNDRGDHEKARFIPVVDTGSSIVLKEEYDSENDILLRIKETFLSLYFGLLSVYRRLIAFFQTF